MALKDRPDNTVKLGDRVVEVHQYLRGRSGTQLGAAFTVDKVYGNGNVTLRDSEGKVIVRQGPVQFRAHSDGTLTQVGAGQFARLFVKETPEVAERAERDSRRRDRYEAMQKAYTKLGRQLQLVADDVLDDPRTGHAANAMCACLDAIDTVIREKAKQ